MITSVIIDGTLLLVLMILMLVKTMHFKKYISSKRRTFVNWLYFDHKAIISSSSKRSIANKQKQNTYSIRIGVVIFLLICAVALQVILLDQPLPGTVRPSERPTAPTIKR